MASSISFGCAVRTQRSKDEEGSSLIFALVFLIVTSLVVISLANLAKNDLVSTQKFKSAQSLESAANSVTELAVDNMRYNFMPQTLNASPPQPCWTAGSSPSQLSLNGQQVAVWCTTRWNPLSESTRVVTFYACQNSRSASNCQASPVLEAAVTFDDYTSPRRAVSNAECTSTCGVAMSIDSWVFDAVPPTVSSISPVSGPVSGGTIITITGTGFVIGATVDFVGTNLSGNVVLPASAVSVSSSTTLGATVPPLAVGESYYVTVTTPTGTSAYGPVYN